MSSSFPSLRGDRISQAITYLLFQVSDDDGKSVSPQIRLIRKSSLIEFTLYVLTK